MFTERSRKFTAAVTVRSICLSLSLSRSAHSYQFTVHSRNPNAIIIIVFNWKNNNSSTQSVIEFHSRTRNVVIVHAAEFFENIKFIF